MPIDAKHEDLQSLRIDRSAHGGEPPTWARRYIIGGIAVVALLSVVALAYRLLAPDVPEVQVTRAAAESSEVGGIVLSATGYIVAHHKINVNTKVTGRVAWIGVEKGDKVKKVRCWFASKTTNSAPSMSKPKAPPTTPGLILKSYKMDRVLRKSRRRSTIWMRPALRW